MKGLQVFSTTALVFSLLLATAFADNGGSSSAESSDEEGEVIEEEPNGPIDFSEAEEQPDGSLCVIKTQYVEKLEKQQIKECWHDNVTQCHETFVTEFKATQEQLCEENFWKACKITFKETSFNYTLQTCMTPLVENCEEAPKSYGAPPPEMVCKTWFESQCNTTYSEPEEEGEAPKPQTWCEKVPKKICAPDNCKMEPGEEVCHDKTLESTVQKPEEVCDLQPSKQCRLVTNLVPHLTSLEICEEIPKEICHLKLDNPKVVRKPVKLKWCTKPKEEEDEEETKPTYGPPPPRYSAYTPVYAPRESYQPQAAAPPPPPTYGSYPKPAEATPPPPPTYGSYPQPVAPTTTAAPAPAEEATASPVYYKPITAFRHRQFRQ